MQFKGLDYIKTAERWHTESKEYFAAGRDYYSETNKTLLTIATLLMGIIGIFIQTDHVLNETLLTKVVLAMGFVSLMTSILLGFFVFMNMNVFFNNAGDYYEKISKNLFKYMQENNTLNGMNYPSEIYQDAKIEGKMNNKLSKIQVGLLMIGLFSVAFILLSY